MKIIEKLAKKANNIYGEKPVTIAFLGDSVTQGCFEVFKTRTEGIDTIFDIEHAYSSKLKKIINTLYPNVQVNVINSGLSGDCSENGLKRLDRDILAFNPDLVVVSYGLNDCSRGLAYLDEYSNNLKNIFNKLQNNETEVVFMTQNMMNTEVSPHLNDFFAELALNFKKIMEDKILDKFFEKAKEIAKNENVKVCDCFAKWKRLYECGVNTTELLSNKLNHPTREMNWLFAYSLIETFFED